MKCWRREDALSVSRRQGGDESFRVGRANHKCVALVRWDADGPGVIAQEQQPLAAIVQPKPPGAVSGYSDATGAEERALLLVDLEVHDARVLHAKNATRDAPAEQVPPDPQFVARDDELNSSNGVRDVTHQAGEP